MKYLIVYLGTLAAFGILDALWLGVIMRKTYVNALGNLMRPDPKWWAILSFYGLFIVGLMIFGIIPHASQGAVKVALFSGLFGFFAYMTYELTNASIIKGWPMSILIPDMIWGFCVSALAGVAGFFIYRALF